MQQLVLNGCCCFFVEEITAVFIDIKSYFITAVNTVLRLDSCDMLLIAEIKINVGFASCHLCNVGCYLKNTTVFLMFA